ncbi:hypothetical protein ACTJK4_12620 [Ralstonia sp. 22111]|uniref:hypothetical protein n=1 Tax=Ralstonia sp. 22111 TaxID=3453878 RepID=UPI003F8602C0
MQPLATNFIIWQLLRPKISCALSVLPIGLMFSAFIPLLLLVEPLERAMGIPHGAPIKEQANGWLWVTLFLATMVVLMLAGATLGWLANALIARVVFRWPAKMVRDAFLHSQVPNTWYREAEAKAEANAVTSRRMDAWATTRQKGKWHFVVVRGLLGWGSPMFFGMSVVPVFLHRVQPSLGYFVSQLLIWATGGALFGFVIWHFSERQFQKHHRETEA